ncbi:uncharacterized protein LOC142742886 [Rhinoderma darwinii]|uniref:uncharacterized protein LOC142742886 n=1 Tax=Rhinoderma darwinii TaxID=43563 RepID=UPI003F67A8C4
MGKPLSRPDCLRQNPACLGKGEEEDGYIEDCYVPQRSIYDTMRINEQIDQGCKLSQPSKSTMDRVEIGTLSSNGTLGTSNACDAKAQETKKLDERVIFDALKLSNDTLKSAPVPPRRRQNADRKENVNRRSWKAFIPPNFPDFAERMEASLSEVSEAGTSSHSLHDKTEFSQLLPDSSKLSSCNQTESISSTSSQIRTPAPSTALPGNQSLDHNVDARCPHVQSFDFYNDSEYEQDPLLAQDNTGLCTRSKPGHNLPSATWPRALRSFIKGGLSDGHHKAAEMAYEECVIETLPLSPCLSDEVLDESSNVLIVPNLREKTFSELKFEEDELKILMEAEEEWEDIDSGGACHSVTVCDGNPMPCTMEESGIIVSNEGSPDKIGFISNLGSLTSLPGDTVMPETSPWPETSEDYSCCSAVNVGRVPTRRYQKLGSYSDSESDADSDQLFLELEQQCLTGVTDEPHESVLELDRTEVNVMSSPHVEPANSPKTIQELRKSPELDTVHDHTYSKGNCIDMITTEILSPTFRNDGLIDITCHGDKAFPVPDELTPVISTQQLRKACKQEDTNTRPDPESDTCHFNSSEEVVTITTNPMINETRTCADRPELPSLQVEEWPKCLRPGCTEVLGLPDLVELLDMAFAHDATELLLGVETPAPVHFPHTDSYSPVGDMERDSCLGSSEQPDESWTCEASFPSTDIISADFCDEVSDGVELTISTTTHGCSSLADEVVDDAFIHSLQSSTSASELQELPDDSAAGGKIDEMSSGSLIKNILFELVVDNGITDTFSTTLQVIDENVITPPGKIENVGSSGVVNVQESNVGVTIITCTEERNGGIDAETSTVILMEPVLKVVCPELLEPINTQDIVTFEGSRKSPSTNKPEIEASGNLVDEQDSRIFSGLNSLSLDARTSRESRLRDDFSDSLSAYDLDVAQNFLTPGKIAEEHCGLATCEVNSIAILQEVILSCSEIDTFTEANVENCKSSKTLSDSSSIELHLSANRIIQSSENDCKDTVSLRQASEEQCESPELSFSQGSTEFELLSEGLNARVNLSLLSDSCPLSVNTADNSLASREEGGSCGVLQSAGDTSEEIICTGQCDDNPTVLSSTTEVTNSVL